MSKGSVAARQSGTWRQWFWLLGALTVAICLMLNARAMAGETGSIDEYGGVALNNSVLLDPFDPVPSIHFRDGGCDWDGIASAAASTANAASVSAATTIAAGTAGIASMAATTSTVRATGPTMSAGGAAPTIAATAIGGVITIAISKAGIANMTASSTSRAGVTAAMGASTGRIRRSAMRAPTSVMAASCTNMRKRSRTTPRKHTNTTSSSAGISST